MAYNAIAIPRSGPKAFSVESAQKGKSLSGRTMGQALRYIMGMGLKFCILTPLLLLSMLAGVNTHAYIYDADYFTVRDVKISGLEKLTENEILNLSNIEFGRNTFHFYLKDISSLLLKNPWVEKVTVRRHLPKGLLIDITERKPFAKIFGKGRLYLIDVKGYIIAEIKNDEYKHLPVIGGATIEKPGSDSLVYPRIFMSGINILKIAKESNFFNGPIAGLRIDNRNEITLFTSGRRTEIKVDRKDLARKLSRLGAIFDYANMEGKTIKSIDLCYKNKAVVKFYEKSNA